MTWCRKTIREIEVNVAYQWFLGLEIRDPVPHFSTFRKNYSRRFKDTDLFEQIFERILLECYKYKLVDPTEVFVDATHVKARANNKKMRKRIAQQEARFYEKQLQEEINTDREGYREYKSCGAECGQCPYLTQCTGSRDHVKTVTRHVWEPYMEMAEDIRCTLGMKELYQQRKQTIERIFGTAKENHGFRYTQQYGKARMKMKVGLTFACMN